MIRHLTGNVHCIGIGGAGMSGLAELLRAYGHTVTGSDRAPSPVTARLETLGVKIQAGHQPDLVKNAGLVIYSSAVREENPERAFARGHGIPELRRAEALGQLMRSYQCVCVAGTHGKTTTTSLLGAVLTEANMHPTVLVGGTLLSNGAPLVIGSGPVMVAEADEFDRSFLAFFPAAAVITNIDADHLDCYKNLAEIKDAFVAFAGRVPFFGMVVCCIDDAGVRDVLPRLPRQRVTYGTAVDADVRAENIEFEAGRPSFDVLSRGVKIGRVSLGVPGMHNVLNALGVCAIARDMGIAPETVAAACAKFRGVKRRFEIVGRGGGATVIDDYAHHPSEISATLAAARRSGFSRVIAVFQPHLYSRTRDFMDAFAASLSAADSVIVADIYQSREEPIPGVTAATIVKKLHELGHRDARYCGRRENCVADVVPRLTDGSAVVVMGAGDITETAAELAGVLHG